MSRDPLSLAWRLARRGAARFGGRPAEFFRCALQLVWAERGKALHGVRRAWHTVQDTCRDGLRTAQGWVAQTRIAQQATAWFNASVAAIGAAERKGDRDANSRHAVRVHRHGATRAEYP